MKGHNEGSVSGGTYVEQREGDHHFTRQEDRLQFLSEMESFLDAHNPADPAPAAPVTASATP